MEARDVTVCTCDIKFHYFDKLVALFPSALKFMQKVFHFKYLKL